MKKFIALVALVLVSASTMMYAQESNAASTPRRKKSSKRCRESKTPCRRRGAGHGSLSTSCTGFEEQTVCIWKPIRLIFRNGMSSFVTSNTNFVLMNGNRATVQTAFQHSLSQALTVSVV